MASQFEAEITQSIAKLQASVQGLERATATAQTRMAGLGAATRTAAAGTASLNQSMERIGQAATRTGGAVGGAVAQTAKLAIASPQLLAVGAAMGFIATKAADWYQEIVRINAALPDTIALMAQAQAGAAATGNRRLLGLDLGADLVARVRGPVAAGDASAVSSAVFWGSTRDEAEGRLSRFRAGAPRLGTGRGAFGTGVRVTPDMLRQVARGFGDADPSAFLDAEARQATDPVAVGAARRQASRRIEDAVTASSEARYGATGTGLIASDLHALAQAIEALRAEAAQLRVAMMIPNAVGYQSARQAEVEGQLQALLERAAMYRNAAESARK